MYYELLKKSWCICPIVSTNITWWMRCICKQYTHCDDRADRPLSDRPRLSLILYRFVFGQHEMYISIGLSSELVTFVMPNIKTANSNVDSEFYIYSMLKACNISVIMFVRWLWTHNRLFPSFLVYHKVFFNKEKESNPNSKTGKWPTITAASTSKTNVDESLI